MSRHGSYGYSGTHGSHGLRGFQEVMGPYNQNKRFSHANGAGKGRIYAESRKSKVIHHCPSGYQNQVSLINSQSFGASPQGPGVSTVKFTGDPIDFAEWKLVFLPLARAMKVSNAFYIDKLPVRASTTGGENGYDGRNSWLVKPLVDYYDKDAKVNFEVEKSNAFILLMNAQCDSRALSCVVASDNDPKLAMELLEEMYNPHDDESRRKYLMDYRLAKLEYGESLEEYVGRIIKLARRVNDGLRLENGDFDENHREFIRDADMVKNVLMEMKHHKIYEMESKIWLDKMESNDDALTLKKLQIKAMIWDRENIIEGNEAGVSLYAGGNDKRKCFNCGKVGHIAKFCKKNNRNDNKGDSDNNGAGGNEGGNNKNINNLSRNGVCYNCGKSGHHAKECKRRRMKKSYDNNVDDDSENEAKAGRSFMAHGNVVGSKSRWIIDTGSTDHITGDLSYLISKRPCNKKIYGFGNSEGTATFVGDVHGYVIDESGSKFNVVIKEVLYCEQFGNINLYSPKQASQYGTVVIFGEHCVITNDDLRIKAKDSEGLKYFNLFMKGDNSFALTTAGTKSIDINVWHHRMGHISTESALRISARKAGFELTGHSNDCEFCSIGKIQKEVISKVTDLRATKILERIFIDLRGPIVKSYGGNQYALMIVDDYSRKKFVYFLPRKDTRDVIMKLEYFFDTVVGNNVVQYIRSDNGGEFTGSEFERFLGKRLIQRELTSSDTPQQNAVAERAISLVFRMAIVMLEHANFHGDLRRLWPEAVSHATYIMNNAPHSLLSNKSPNEIFFNKLDDLSVLSTFGSVSFVLHGKRTKFDLDPAGELVYYVGVAPNKSKAGRFFRVRTKAVIETRNFIIHEGQMNKINVEPSKEYATNDLKFVLDILSKSATIYQDRRSDNNNVGNDNVGNDNVGNDNAGNDNAGNDGNHIDDSNDDGSNDKSSENNVGNNGERIMPLSTKGLIKYNEANGYVLPDGIKRNKNNEEDVT